MHTCTHATAHGQGGKVLTWVWRCMHNTSINTHSCTRIGMLTQICIHACDCTSTHLSVASIHQSEVFILHNPCEKKQKQSLHMLFGVEVRNVNVVFRSTTVHDDECFAIHLSCLCDWVNGGSICVCKYLKSAIVTRTGLEQTWRLRFLVRGNKNMLHENMHLWCALVHMYLCLYP